MEYIRFSKDYNKNSLIPVTDDVYKHIDDDKKPYFISMIKYNQQQYEEYQKTRTLASMHGSTTDRLWADFDLKSMPLEATFKDAYVFCERLMKLGFKEENLQISFSGNKGIGIIIDTEERLTIEQVRAACVKLAEGLPTFDNKMYDHQRIFRLLFTKHEVTGLHKIPLTLEELKLANIPAIKDAALDISGFNKAEVLSFYKRANVKLPTNLTQVSIVKKEKKSIELSSDIFTDKPREWRNCKWSLLQGNFKEGERHNVFTVLGATCRGLKYDREQAYYLCKSALKKQAQKTDQEEFSTDELWENILESIYGPTWNGGQFTCETEGWLKDYCQSLGEHSCKKHEQTTVQIHSAFDMFRDYAKNIDDLTIKTGIDEIDRKLRLTIGMFVGIVGSPGSGKTSLAIQILNSMSKRNECCVFFSYDMYHSLVIQKLVQKHFKIKSDDMFNRMKSNDMEFENKVLNLLKTEYANVEFCFDSGQTVEQIQNTIKLVEEKTGKNVRLVVVDYNELILTEHNDSTAGSAYVAQKLREIANKFNTCVVSLLQPSKVFASPDAQILTMQAAKGSSAIGQAMSVMLGINRPAFHPNYPQDDKYLTVTCLKNRMGELFRSDLAWDGLTGNVRTMTAEEKGQLSFILEQRKKEKDEEKLENW